MIHVLGIINVLLLFLISGFHFYWGFGGKIGGDVVLPEMNKGGKVFKPTPIATCFVALVFLFFGLLPLMKLNIITIALPQVIHDYGLMILGVIFCIRGIGDFKYLGFFKSVKGTKFSIYDSKWYSPLSFFMGANFFLIDFLS